MRPPHTPEHAARELAAILKDMERAGADARRAARRIRKAVDTMTLGIPALPEKETGNND